jgi:hypothetical protein
MTLEELANEASDFETEPVGRGKVLTRHRRCGPQWQRIDDELLRHHTWPNEVSPICVPGVSLPACYTASLYFPRALSALVRPLCTVQARGRGSPRSGVLRARDGCGQMEAGMSLDLDSVFGDGRVGHISTTPTRATSSAQGRSAERIPVSSCAFMTFNLRLTAPMPGA